MVTPPEALLWLSASIALIVGGYMVIGCVGALLYRPQQGDERAENVIFAITTVGSTSVRPALMDGIDHHLERFPDYPLYVTIDEGSDLVPELVADTRFTTVVVPTDFECKATAKGRAQQYFTETVVSEHPDSWVCFFDDDNKILSRDILFEIPYYEARGYGAANAVLVPRMGRSEITFVMDHLRTIDDLTVFRALTGLLRRPYMGFHGELLTVRGDVLLDITFDRPSLVEDYAFGMRVLQEGVKTWQTDSRISILSPHTLHDLFRQRRRWYLGLMAEQTWTPPLAKVFMSLRLVTWTLALIGGVAFLPAWLLIGGVKPPALMEVIIGFGTIVYTLGYLYGAKNVGRWYWPLHFLLFPVYAIVEAFTGLYALARPQSDFAVIDK